MEVAAGAALVGGSFLLATAKRGGKPRQARRGSLPAPISAAVVAGAALFLGLKALSGRKDRGWTQIPEDNTTEEAAALPNGHADSGDRAEPAEASGKKDSEDVTEDQVSAISDPPPPVSVSGTPHLKVKVGDVSAPETPVGVEREHVSSRMPSRNDNETSPFDTAPNSPFYSDALPDFDSLLGNGDGDYRRERFHGDDCPSAVNAPLELLLEKDADSLEGRGVKAGVGGAHNVSAILARVKAAAARAEILHSKVLEMNNTEST